MNLYLQLVDVWVKLGGPWLGLFSSDFGNTWISKPIPANEVLEFFSNGNIVASGFFYDASDNIAHYLLTISKDTCNSWTEIDSINCHVGLLASNSSSEYLLVGTEDLGVFLYSDEGTKIGVINEGLTNLNIQALTADNNGYIYAGTENGLWRRPLSEVTSIKEESITIPSVYILSQNYPNPFNPSTTFRYSITNASKVTIKIYDVLGKEIEKLVNEEKPTGTYELNWNAANLPSGVYFYQIKAGEFCRQKRCF